MRFTNLTLFDPLVRIVQTSGTPVRLSPYQVGTGIAFNRNNPTADTITDSSSGFLVAGFQAGDFITISGSTSNDTTTGFEIATVTSGTLTLVAGNFLTTEAAGVSVTLDTLQGFKVSDGVEVTVYALTANTGTITLAPTSARAVNTVTGYHRHIRLLASQSITIPIKNLRDLWADATVSNEGLAILLER